MAYPAPIRGSSIKAKKSSPDLSKDNPSGYSSTESSLTESSTATLAGCQLSEEAMKEAAAPTTPLRRRNAARLGETPRGTLQGGVASSDESPFSSGVNSCSGSPAVTPRNAPPSTAAAGNRRSASAFQSSAVAEAVAVASGNKTMCPFPSSLPALSPPMHRLRLGFLAKTSSAAAAGVPQPPPLPKEADDATAVIGSLSGTSEPRPDAAAASTGSLSDESLGCGFKYEV